MAPQIPRLALVFGILLTAFLVVRTQTVPASFGEKGFYRGDFPRELAELSMSHAGSKACMECHPDKGETTTHFVNGVNCANYDGRPVSVNSINAGINAGLYIDNDLGMRFTEMDGMTVPLECVAAVNPNVRNHVKIAIADRQPPGASGDQRRLVDQVGQVRAGEARRAAGDRAQIDVFIQGDLAGVHP